MSLDGAEMTQITTQSKILWNEALEQLVKGLGEKALSMSWLHNFCEKRFSYFNNFLAIPAIILSTITGAGTVAFGSNNETVAFAMGALSITVSIISTLNSYFTFAKRAEAHRITSVSYSKLYLMISIELSLPRERRMGPKDFLKVCSEQIQRLNEIQPLVADAAIKAYNIKFKDEPPTISRPECTNGLVDIRVYIDDTLQKQRSFIDGGVKLPVVEEAIVAPLTEDIALEVGHQTQDTNVLQKAKKTSRPPPFR